MTLVPRWGISSKQLTLQFACLNPLHVELLLPLKRIGISFRPALLCSMAPTLEPAALGRAGLDGFQIEAAGDGQRAFARELQQLLHSEFAWSSSFPEVRGGWSSASQMRSGLIIHMIKKNHFLTRRKSLKRRGCGLALHPQLVARGRVNSSSKAIAPLIQIVLPCLCGHQRAS